MCVLRGVRGGPIYTSGGRFPPNARMEGDEETWGDSSSKCTWTGGRPGSADLGGWPAPPGRLSSLSFTGRLHVGPDIFLCMHYAWRAHLLCQMGPLCKWVTPDAIFYVVMWRLLCVFFLFRSCSSQIYKTRKQLWSKVSDTNMQVRCLIFLYY